MSKNILQLFPLRAEMRGDRGGGARLSERDYFRDLSDSLLRSAAAGKLSGESWPVSLVRECGRLPRISGVTWTHRTPSAITCELASHLLTGNYTLPSPIPPVQTSYLWIILVDSKVKVLT